MKISIMLLVLSFTQMYSIRAEKVYLLNTLNASSELDWKTFSNHDEKDGWLEETTYSKREKVNRQVYSTCSLNLTSIENWLLMPRLETKEAARLEIEIGFTIVRCGDVPSQKGSCKETLKLFAIKLQEGEELPHNWHNETKWELVDTLVSKSEVGEENVEQVQVSSYVVSSPIVQFALRNTGACSSIVYVKVYYVSSPDLSWWQNFNSYHQLWLLVFLVLVLLLCCILMVASRYSCLSRKQLGDLSVPENYKQANAPLLPLFKESRTTSIGLSNRIRPYVDPTAYEDPNQALADFTNEIEPENVQVTRVIGAGEFGEVCCGRLTVKDIYGQIQQHVVAVKTLLPGSSSKAKKDFLTEAMSMGQFEHENVIHLLGVVTITEPVMILTEYMMNGSLDQFLRNNDNGSISAYQLVQMLHGIACGMKYLTEKAYVHRDLAARNVLVDDLLTCKIADFGLSRWLTEGSGEQEYTTQNGGKIPLRWTAPEAISHLKYTAQSDVWSYGVVMWEVFSFGERPYWEWTNHKVIHEVENGFRLPCPMDAPPQIYNVMLACWQADRHKRPEFANIVSQIKSFLNEVDFFSQNCSKRFSV